MIFEWVADRGLTLRQVVRQLQQLRIKPRESKRGVWNTSTLSSTLADLGSVGEGILHALPDMARNFDTVSARP